MLKSRTKFICLLVGIILVVGAIAGCATNQRPNDNDNVAPPTPTRAPGNNNAIDNDTNWNNVRDDNLNDGVADDRDDLDMRNDNGRNTMRLADDIAQRVANMQDVGNATVFVTGDNAYVAVDMPGNRQGHLTNDLKGRIAKTVRGMDNDIDDVYVSADPDFFNRMGKYAGDVRNGRPIQGMVNQITETIRRVFPTTD